MATDINTVFQTHFSSVGDDLRPEQSQIIHAVLNGQRVLGLLPTGAGKSLCYWVAGKVLGGVTLVVSPLTALMDEQASKLQELGCLAYVWHSGIGSEEQYNQLISLYRGSLPEFIFLSPERLATDGFLEFVMQRIRDRIKLVVIDEAHCISQWGEGFRPFYRDIPPFLDHVFGQDSWPRILGLTATLGPRDVAQMCDEFGIDPEQVIYSDVMLRHEINLNVVKVASENEKDQLLWRTLADHKDDKVLVYVDRREGKRSAETLCAAAKALGYSAEYFHAGLTSDAKSEVINRFKSGELMMVFATNAFGMGIDIPDIRGVIHYLLPESIEHYYQQIGRAGRDKKPSWSLLFYSDKNVDVRKRHFIANSFPDADSMRNAFLDLSDHKVGKSTFSYFTESEEARSCYHHLLRSGAVKVLGKGFQNLGVFKVAKGKTASKFDDFLAASRTGLMITTAKNTGQSESEIAESIYHLLAEGKLKLDKMPAKCLIVESLTSVLPDDLLTQIMNDVSAKRDYRFSVFDQFVKLLDEFQESVQFHQEIGLYLGVDKFKLGRIYETLSGVWVRSKSEVIIANLLFERNVQFKYEEQLIVNGVSYSPDFTIAWNECTFYWEHLGLMNREKYRNDWKAKRKMYHEHFPNYLLTTEESPHLSRDTERIINTHFSAVS